MGNNGRQLKSFMKSAVYGLSLALSTSAVADPLPGGIIWQGMDHEWKRFVLLPNEGRIPHRISRLSSYALTESASEEAVNGTFHFAQSTGVDGNFMHPKGYYSPLYARGLEVYHDRIDATWTDAIENAAEVPTAESRHEYVITRSIPEQHTASAILNGIDIDVSCDNEKQPSELPCNSNGLWPYDLYIGFEACTFANGNASADTKTAHCPLTITLNRGWTPNRGGLEIPPFIDETKPLNYNLDIRLTVHYSLVTAPAADLAVFYPDPMIHTQTLQDPEPYSGEAVIEGQHPSGESQLLSGITGFGFQLHEPLFMQDIWTLLGSDLRQRGPLPGAHYVPGR